MLYGQAVKKEYSISRISVAPKIDGILDDAVWQNLAAADDFFMLEPGNGNPEKPGFETSVKVVYDDLAIYFAIQMKDPNPDSILTQLSRRDRYTDNNDWFGVFINPYNDGLNDFNFWVTAAGVQADSRTTANGDDFGWNTVWKSAIKITDQGWIIELSIPYQSLRFPEGGDGTWGLNMIRHIRRYREEYSWNFIDKNIEAYELQAGLLTGVTNINSPLRLSIIPNVTGSFSAIPETDGQNGEIYTTSNSFNAGADIKYGLTESFTLDVTLLPDFTQVAYDKQILNLGPFENRFDEQRQFFKEGIELFNKGDLFYSRRIGGAPKNITGASFNDDDDIKQNTTRMLNATKVSGRTKRNLGIGVLNAITQANYATATDSNGVETQILTEPLTNYNVISFDQRFNQNSSISLVNTNVLRNGALRDANVTALFIELANRQNAYKFVGTYKYSAILEQQTTTGFQMINQFFKTKGQFRFEFRENVISENYNQNDLGFQRRNNKFNHDFEMSWETFEPNGIFNKYKVSMNTYLDALYQNLQYETFGVETDFFAKFKSFDAGGGRFNFNPIGGYNYFEPRVWGKKFKNPSSLSTGLWFSSDYRRKFAGDVRVNYWQWSDYNYKGMNFSIRPRYRFTDHFFMLVGYKPEWKQNNIGWINTLSEDSIVFGMRDIIETELNLTARYVFNKDISLEVNFRHFWTTVNYKEHFLLQDDGSLVEYPQYQDDHDINFNSLNIDIRFGWWYAPNSEIVLLYRNSYLNSDKGVDFSYQDNLLNSLRANQDHTISFRITYFFDVNYVKKLKRNKM